MTDSKNENLATTQNRLSPQNENFDFELADIKITTEQVDPTAIPLDSFVAAEADMQQGSEENIAHHPYNANQAAPLIPPASVASEIKTNFYVDYFDQRKNTKKPKKTNPEPVSVEKINQSTIDDRSQESMIPEENSAPSTEQPFTDDSHAPVIDGAGMAVAVLSQFKSKQERINKQQEELIHEFSAKIKSATTVTYTAVFFGIVALVAATTLGIMLSKTKAEISDLTGTTTAIKDDIRNIAKAAPDDLEGTDPSIDQLNQKVDDVIEQLNEVTARQNKTSGSEKPAVIAKAAMNAMPAPIEKPAVIAKPVTNVTPAAVEKPAVIAKPETTKPLVNTVVAEKKPTPEVATKAPPASKAVKTAPAEKTATVVKVTTDKPDDSNDKTANKTGVYIPKKISDIPDKAMQVPANDINKVVNAAASASKPASPTAPPVTTSKPQAGSSFGWTVNLGSSNKLDEAKKTANSFAQKGIPVSISSATVKNATRYRLQVKGFKTKEEASAFANKAKATLNLNSVWINP